MPNGYEIISYDPGGISGVGRATIENEEGERFHTFVSEGGFLDNRTRDERIGDNIADGKILSDDD
ncbi:MAG: hypothetical protein WCT28_00335 [Patescibacteria group bacterium]